MYAEEFSQILTESVLVTCISLVIYTGVIVLILAWVNHNGAKYDGNKKQKRKLGLSANKVVVIGILILNFSIMLFDVIPILKDMRSENYICVHGEYVRKSEYASASNGQARVVVFLDGEDVGIGLEIPKVLKRNPVDDERFPVTTGYGTIWYTGNSECILKFIPDEP